MRVGISELRWDFSVSCENVGSAAVWCPVMSAAACDEGVRECAALRWSFLFCTAVFEVCSVLVCAEADGCLLLRAKEKRVFQTALNRMKEESSNTAVY